MLLDILTLTQIILAIIVCSNDDNKNMTILKRISLAIVIIAVMYMLLITGLTHNIYSIIMLWILNGTTLFISTILIMRKRIKHVNC